MTHPNFRTGLPCNCAFGRPLEAHQYIAAVSGLTPWEPGMQGKGVYWPEDDHLSTWQSDPDAWDTEIHHGDVVFDDENIGRGWGHHLDIYPDGKVMNQGAFDENYDDVPGLQPARLDKALKSHNPHLYVLSNRFDFNDPTEPVPTSPEHADKDGHHSPQISNDWTGFGG